MAYDDRVKTSVVVWTHVQQNRLCPGTKTLSEWLDLRWLRIFVRGRAIPVLPSWGFKNDLVLHDIHHMLTGYDTSLRGELELAAWELRSGGCGWNAVMWLDRLSVVSVGLLLAPRLVVSGYRRGRGCHNLYGKRRQEVLGMDFADVVRAVGVPTR